MSDKCGLKRKNPWVREPEPWVDYSDIYPERYKFDEDAFNRPRFASRGSTNIHLDIDTKRAAIKVAPSVVSLVSYSGEEEIYQSSGTIIECDSSNRAIVLTSANLVRRPTREDFMDNTLADNLKVVVFVFGGRSYEGYLCAHDFHYNLAAIRFHTDTSLTVATLTHVDDSMSVDLRVDKAFQLRPCSSLSTYNLVPGCALIATGRYFAKTFDIMAAPGEFRLDLCEYDCKELLMVSCNITRCGDGGPLVNLAGEVVGVTFYDLSSTPVMPINIACKWWEHFKTYGKHCRPSLGMQLTNFYVADIENIEMVVRKFPNICKGVFVEMVLPGSPPYSAGIRPDDVIIECDGKPIQGFLEFFEMMWDKVGELVDLVVARADQDTPLRLRMTVVEAKEDKLNRWPRWDYSPTRPRYA